MTSPELAPADWEPAFTDYFHLSLTNITAFSPTDVVLVSLWAKNCDAGAVAVSFSNGALVIGRAANILKHEGRGSRNSCCRTGRFISSGHWWGVSNWHGPASVGTEKCESGRIGLTANELTWETGSEGSNPSFSATHKRCGRASSTPVRLVSQFKRS